MPQQTRFYTWCSSTDDRRGRIFGETCRINGIHLNVIPCNRIIDKPVTLAKAIREVPDEDLIVCTDSFDVICLRGQDAIAEGFLNFNSELVFSAESLCFHHLPSSINKFNNAPSDATYKILNSGMFMGRASFVREMLEIIASWDHLAMGHEFASSGAAGSFNDQTLFGHYFSLFSSRVSLDYEARLFWNVISDTGDLNNSINLNTDPIVNRVTNTSPSFVHVTRLRDYYYPFYLKLARRVGVKLNSRNSDIERFNLFVTRSLPYISDYPCPIDPDIKKDLQATLAYRYLKLRLLFVSILIRIRRWFGRLRRAIFS